MAIGENVRHLRTLAELTARDVDRLTGKALGQTALIEARGTDVRAGTLLPYAALFGVTLDWLIARKGPEPTRDGVREAVAQARAKPPAKRAKKRSGKRARPIRAATPKPSPGRSAAA